MFKVVLKLTGLFLLAVWISFGFRSGKAYFKVGGWLNNPFRIMQMQVSSLSVPNTIILAEADGDSDSGDTEFA